MKCRECGRPHMVERDHVKTVARHGGVCDAYMLVHGMLRDYRAAKARVCGARVFDDARVSGHEQ